MRGGWDIFQKKSKADVIELVFTPLRDSSNRVSMGSQYPIKQNKESIMTPDQINRQSKYVQEAFVQLLDERNNAHNRAEFYHKETKKLSGTVVFLFAIIGVMGMGILMMNNVISNQRVEMSRMASEAYDNAVANAEALKGN